MVSARSPMGKAASRRSPKENPRREISPFEGQIERMQQESAEAGDMVAVAVCQIALGCLVLGRRRRDLIWAVIHGWLADAVAEVDISGNAT